MPSKIFRSALLILSVTLTACGGQDGLLVSAFDKDIPTTPSDLLAIQQAAQEVAQKARACTVGLSLRNAMGSGVVISEDGYVLTAAHVVSQPGEEVKIQFPDGREATGVSLGLHTTADGALVKITGEGPWPFIKMIEPNQRPKVGQWCVAVGHPRGFIEERTPPVRLGRVIEFTSQVIRTDCTITGGDSGGPLVDMQGRVIGIHSRISNLPTENFHVPIAAIHEAWDRLIEGKYYPDAVPSEFLALLDVDKDGYLTRTELTSGAERAVFDRLLEQFGLDDEQPLEITKITEDVFRWREKPQPGLTPLGAELSLFKALPARYYARGPEMRERFESLINPASKATIRVMDDGVPVVLGVVVRDDGFLLTKASSLTAGELTCSLPSGQIVPATLVATDQPFDVALLKADATDLESVVWSDAEPEPGSWLIVPDTLGRVASLGVLGVSARKIPEIRAVIGVTLSPQGTRISYVSPKGGANAAGLSEGDVIVRMADTVVRSIDEIQKVLSAYRAGDKVSTVVDRDGETIEAEVLLGALEDVFFELGGHWELSGPLSRRRDGFPSAIQLDAVLRPSMCGGPVVDASGKVIGITLARADRVSTYAATYRDLRATVERLLSTATVPVRNPIAEKK